jgi:UDP-N-acetylmuramate dehydrogenase
VRFRLSKKNHRIHTHYGAIQDELATMHITKPEPIDIAKAVINIRQSKLPDPSELGNSGSFFKNPVISLETYKALKYNFPDIPSYPVDENQVKVPAGWLIEHTGLKGYREGDAGVHKKQALVLVNYGEATGKNVLDLAQKVKTTVEHKFGIALEAEVNVF